VIVLGVVAVLALAAFGSTFTPLFSADSVRVEGAAHLTPDQVRRIAKVEPGVNVFRLDAAKAERRLERNAWVADAQVETSLPSQVTIIVRERIPAAVALSDATGERSVIAGDGTILGAATDTTALPTVEVGDGTTPPSQAQRALGAAAAASLPHSIVGEVETVRVGEDGSIELSLDGGVVASYGDGSELEAKGYDWLLEEAVA
jgi:cell division protein FtsQ